MLFYVYTYSWRIIVGKKHLKQECIQNICCSVLRLLKKVILSHLCTCRNTTLVLLLLTCSFVAQKPPLCSGKCSHCVPRLQTLFPLQWRPRLLHVGWWALTRTPSGAFVGQSALRSSVASCHQNHLWKIIR